MVSPRLTTVPGSAIQASVPSTSLEIRASLRLTTVPVADSVAARFSARAVVTTTGTGGGASAAAAAKLTSVLSARMQLREFLGPAFIGLPGVVCQAAPLPAGLSR